MNFERGVEEGKRKDGGKRGNYLKSILKFYLARAVGTYSVGPLIEIPLSWGVRNLTYLA